VGRRDVEGLVAALKEKKTQRCALRRFRLVKALGKAEDPRAVEPLSTLLRTDRSAEVRGVAAMTLGQIGDPSAVLALKSALSDPENRWRAIHSLGLLRDLSSVPWFIGYFRSTNPLTREFAADALGEIGDWSASPALIEALDDPKASVRQSTAIALAKMGDPQALEPVRLAHRSAKGLSRWYIGKALAQLEGRKDMNPKWLNNQVVIEEKFATPFMVVSMLGQAVGIRGSRGRRLAETNYLARGFFWTKSPQETLEFLEKAVQEFPDDAELRVLYASTLLDFRIDDVASEARKAAELGQDDPAIQIRAGRLLLDRGDQATARACAARANELVQPDSIFMADLDNLNGLLAARAGEDDLAEENFRSALQREPEWSSRWLSLARFLWARGRDEEALAVLDESLPHVREDVDRDLLEQLREKIVVG
jgi:HEAT repeat protein